VELLRQRAAGAGPVELAGRMGRRRDPRGSSGVTGEPPRIARCLDRYDYDREGKENARSRTAVSRYRRLTSAVRARWRELGRYLGDAHGRQARFARAFSTASSATSTSRETVTERVPGVGHGSDQLDAGEGGVPALNWTIALITRGWRRTKHGDKLGKKKTGVVAVAQVHSATNRAAGPARFLTGTVPASTPARSTGGRRRRTGLTAVARVLPS